MRSHCYSQFAVQRLTMWSPFCSLHPGPPKLRERRPNNASAGEKKKNTPKHTTTTFNRMHRVPYFCVYKFVDLFNYVDIFNHWIVFPRCISIFRHEIPNGLGMDLQQVLSLIIVWRRSFGSSRNHDAIDRKYQFVGQPLVETSWIG